MPRIFLNLDCDGHGSLRDGILPICLAQVVQGELSQRLVFGHDELGRCTWWTAIW